MVKTFDEKFRELEQKKSELDLSFLQLQKKEYVNKLSDLLSNPNYEGDEDIAIEKFAEARMCYAKITLIDFKIQHLPETYEKQLSEIDDKIAFYKSKRERIKHIPLYKNTEEGIYKILGTDSLYQYAQDTNNEELMKKLEKRSLTPEEYDNYKEKMYKNLFSLIFNKEHDEKQVSKRIKIQLPRGMSEQIFEELKDNKDIKPQDIEKFLKNELKKNAGEIKISHIKNSFKDKFNQAYKYIKRLIINYPGFIIVDNSHNKNQSIEIPTKREKLISSVSTEESEENKTERLKKSNLLFKLSEIGKIDDLKMRISKYLDLFEELNHSFSDRKNFEPYVFGVISIHTHIEIEKEIIKTLNSLIQGNFRTERTGLYRYHVYKFNRASRRMLAYPNGEIFTICPHEEYEKIINSQPPLEKS